MAIKSRVERLEYKTRPDDDVALVAFTNPTPGESSENAWQRWLTERGMTDADAEKYRIRFVLHLPDPN